MNRKECLSIIVVTNNSCTDIDNFITSFFKYKPECVFEILIVDNHSNDNTLQIIRKYSTIYPEIIVVSRTEKNGFGNNCNFGLRKAKGNIIAFLNPDIVFIQNSLIELSSFLVNSSYGILGPRLLNSDSSIQYSARRFISFKILIFRLLAKGKDDIENSYLSNYFYNGLLTDKIFEVDWVTGAAMFIKKEVFESINGGFDEIYRLYIEDQDLCYMALQKGWKTIYYPQASLVHIHQRSSVSFFGKKTLYHLQGLMIFFLKKTLGIKGRLK